MTRVGFIGLGVMGRPMAARIRAGGHELFLYARRSPPPELIAAGAAPMASPRQVAESAEVVITMLPDTPDVAEVLFGGDSAVAPGLAPGKIVVDMSSISPTETKVFASRISDLGCTYLDAPVSGGEVGAKAGTLTIMVGGPAAAFSRMRPIFELLGKNVTHLGDSGAGQTCKVANQIIVAATIEAVAEALLLSAKAGVDPAKVRQALLGGFASSRILEVHGERMLKRHFEPGFRVALHSKDLRLATETARQLGVSLPATAICSQILNACTAAGGADWDHSAMVRVLETLAAFELSG